MSIWLRISGIELNLEVEADGGAAEAGRE